MPVTTELTTALAQSAESLASRFVLTSSENRAPARAWADALLPLAEQVSELALQAENVDVLLIAKALVQCLQKAKTVKKGSQDALKQQMSADLDRLTKALAAAEPKAPQAPAEDASRNSLGEDAELLADFILEAREHLKNGEQCLLALEKNPSDIDPIREMFRGFHTIKGLASFLALTEVHDVCHEIESLLDLARNSKLTITPEIVDALLEGADYVTNETNRIETMLQGRKTGKALPNEELRAKLRDLASGAPAQQSPSKTKSCESKEETLDFPALEAAAEVEILETSLGLQAGIAPPAAQVADKQAPAAQGSPSKMNEHSSEQRLLKVETVKVDYLVDMVGELLVTQSLLRHDIGQQASVDLRIARNLSQLVRITDEVQRAAMAMRLVPVGQLFQKMKRLVRDISRKSG
jgi:two-component system chemotaxis sensor kinase CheA